MYFCFYCKCSSEMHHCILYLCHIYCTCTRVTTVLKLWTRLLTVGLHSRLILYGGVTALYCYSVTVVQCKSVTTVLQGKPVGLHAQVILCCGAKGQTFVIEAHFKCPEFKFVLYGKYSMKHQIFDHYFHSFFYRTEVKKEGQMVKH